MHNLKSSPDKNMHYFHLITVGRCKHNRIELLQDDNGQWVNDPGTLKMITINYFKHV